MLRLYAFVRRVNISTVIAQATTCITIRAMAFGKSAPGNGAEACSPSGRLSPSCQCLLSRR